MVTDDIKRIVNLANNFIATLEWVNEHKDDTEVIEFRKLMKEVKDGAISELGFGSVRLFYIDELIKEVEDND